MILNKQIWNNEQIENNFFLFKKEQGAENCGDEIAFHPKYYPFWKKSLSEYALGHKVETTAVS